MLNNVFIVPNFFSPFGMKKGLSSFYRTAICAKNNTEVLSLALSQKIYFHRQQYLKVKFSPDSTEPSSGFTPSNIKLFYLVCSRTINNLTVVKVVISGEEQHLLATFPDFQKVRCGLRQELSILRNEEKASER